MKIHMRENILKAHSPLYILGENGQPLQAYLYVSPAGVSFGSELDGYSPERIAIPVPPAAAGGSLIHSLEYRHSPRILQDLVDNTEFAPDGPKFNTKAQLAMAAITMMMEHVPVVSDPINQELNRKHTLQ